MDKTSPCPCSSQLTFAKCCEPYISNNALPNSAEALMRSRFSAYATNNFQYIADTYATAEQSAILLNNTPKTLGASAEEIKRSSENTKWCKLEIKNTSENTNSGIVEFIAYYQTNYQFYTMHERSRFIKVENKWLYVDGEMLGNNGAVKLGRNEDCLCGSGKKFKRCCQGASI